jgi:alkane 1-monooxygenase
MGREATAWRVSDLRFLLVLLLPVTVFVSVWSDPARSWCQAVFGYLLVVAVDAVWPRAQRSPSSSPSSAYFTWIIRLYVPLQLLLQVSAVWVVGHSDWFVALSLAMSVGMVAGAVGITVAHELGHSPHRLDRFLAWLLMSSVCYAHFMVEHYRGHHPRAATFDDPASARKGESFWRYLARALPGSFVHALQLEARRLHQFKKSWLRSPLAWVFTAKVAFLLTLMARTEVALLVFFCVQAMFAIGFLEAVNYIDHYGLQRRGKDSRRIRQSDNDRIDWRLGLREPFGPMHAWNADHVLTNSLFINRQRHSDHHINPWKPYASLEHLPDSPQLPTGYAGCILLAMVPPLWFAVMNPRLGQAKAHFHPDEVHTQPGVVG